MKRAWFAGSLVLALTISAFPQSKPRTAHPAKSKQRTAEKVEAAPVPAEPVKPPVPAQRPPVPARVSLTNGLVTVIAENSTLTDVLNGIEKVSGVKIDSGGIVSHERVAAQIGPAPVREVLYSLLQGSRYDYIILSSLKDPEIVERVVLTPKVAGNSQPAAGNAPRPAQPIQEIEPVDVMDSGDGNEGFAPPAATPISPPPGSQPPPDNRSPEQIREDERKDPGNPNQVPQNRDARPERPR